MKKQSIGFKDVFIDLIESIGIKQGFFVTLKDLILKPESVVNYFIETRQNNKLDRSKYLSPLKLLMYIFAVIAIISFFVGHDISMNQNMEMYEENESVYDEESMWLLETEYGLAYEEFTKKYENEEFKKLMTKWSENKIIFTIILAVVASLISKLLFFRNNYNIPVHFVIHIYLASITLILTPLLIWLDPKENMIIIISIVYYIYCIARIFKTRLVSGIIKGGLTYVIPVILIFTPWLIHVSTQMEEAFLIEYPQYKEYNTCIGDCDNGEGTYTFANGAKYVGEFKDGLRHGEGTYTFANGAKYVGEWKDGVYHGQGTLSYVDGEKYVGEFKEDMFNGKGTYTFANGNKYVGEFKDGLRHGQGTLSYVDGEEFSGQWEYDELINK